MNKIINFTFIAFIAFYTTTLLSCSKDNNDNSNEKVTVNPLKVFAGGLPKSIDGGNIQTNSKGQVTNIQTANGTKVTFEYTDNNTRSVSTIPDVIMTIEEDNEKLVCNLYLNKKGFVSHCDEVKYYRNSSNENYDQPTNETWNFTYNEEGKLLTMMRSEGGNEKTTIKYQDGNIVETATTSEKEPNEKTSYKVYYSSSTMTTPIVNKGCIMLFDQTLGIDMDEMVYAYYAGLLGKSTKHLPIRLIEKDSSEKTFSWELNNSGYPETLTYTDGGFEKIIFRW